MLELLVRAGEHGPDINTSGRDCWYKITTDGRTAYYAQKSGRRHDIYAVELPEDKRPQTITVLRTNQPMAIENLSSRPPRRPSCRVRYPN